MADEPVSFTCKLSLQDCLDIQRIHSRVVFRPAIRFAMKATATGIAALVIFAGMKSHFMAGHFATIAICAFFVFGCDPVDRLLVRRRYIRNQSSFIESAICITRDFIATKNARGECKLTWDNLSCIIATSRGILFLLRPQQAWIWLPLRLFEGNMHRENILELAEKNKIPVRQKA